jgi:hypothetical protein
MILYSILFLFFNLNAAPKPVVKEVYFNLFAGHLHQGPNPESTSLKLLNCGDNLRVISEEKEVKTSSKFEWVKLQTGEYIGYVRKEFLSNETPSCFNNKFMKFVDQFKLEITDKYNWGRLYDNYVWGKSKVK